VLEAFEVDRHAVRCSDLVLTRVAPADGSALIVRDAQSRFEQLREDRAAQCDELLFVRDEGEDGCMVGCDARRETQNDVAAFGIGTVRIEHDGEDRAVEPEGG
ncbi:hypothetical protein RZS08_55950, partial [Arthrospira platensis SPKY1]|nr:hypothetical protein [Arthrospira platensis SPKY1]